MSELGIEVIYSTSSDNLVSCDEIEERAEKYKIPLDLLPRPIGEESLFKRATSSMATNVCTNESPIICRELPKNKSPKNTVVRVFEKRLVDKDILIEMATMFFNKTTGNIKYSIITEEGRDIIEKVLKKCSNEGYSTEKEVRASIQRASNVFMGVKLRRNGGVFFIPKQFVPYWDNYAKIYKGHNCIEFADITVNDDFRGKNTIYNAIEKEIKESICDEIGKFGVEVSPSGRLNDIVKAFKDTVISGEIKIDAFSNMVKRFYLYVKKVKVYKDLIGSDLDGIYYQVVSAKEFLEEEFNEREELCLFG